MPIIQPWTIYCSNLLQDFFLLLLSPSTMSPYINLPSILAFQIFSHWLGFPFYWHFSSFLKHFFLFATSSLSFSSFQSHFSFFPFFEDNYNFVRKNWPPSPYLTNASISSGWTSNFHLKMLLTPFNLSHASFIAFFLFL